MFPCARSSESDGCVPGASRSVCPAHIRPPMSQSISQANSEVRSHPDPRSPKPDPPVLRSCADRPCSMAMCGAENWQRSTWSYTHHRGGGGSTDWVPEISNLTICKFSLEKRHTRALDTFTHLINSSEHRGHNFYQMSLTHEGHPELTHQQLHTNHHPAPSSPARLQYTTTALENGDANSNVQ